MTTCNNSQDDSSPAQNCSSKSTESSNNITDSGNNNMAKSSNHFSHFLLLLLPDEILLVIFSYVRLRDLATTLYGSVGSRRLRNLCRDRTLCERVVVAGKDWDRQTARRAILMAGDNLSYLELSSENLTCCHCHTNDDDAAVHNISSQLAILALERCHNLVWLKCQRSGMSSSVVSAIGRSRSVSKLTLAEHYYCYRCRYNNRDCCSLSKLLLAPNPSDLRNLRHIDMAHVKEPSYSDIQSCKMWIKIVADNCLQLQHLDISAFDIADDTFKYLLDRRGSSLKYLSAMSYWVTAAAYRQLRFCTHLEELKLFYPKFLNLEGLCAIAELSKSLKRLTLQLSSFYGIDLATAFEGKKTTNLVELNLYFQGVRDVGLEAIARTFPNLEKVSLGEVIHFSDKGVSALLRHCQKLKHLEVCCYSPVTAEAFAGFSTRNNLTLIVSEGIVKDVEKAMPLCKVHNCDFSDHGRYRN